MAGQISSDDDVISGINVTPLVDIMLVLLIIFMVTATYIVNKSIELQLPEAESAQAINKDDKSMNIAVSEDGALFFNGEELKMEGLAAKIQAEKAAHPEAKFYAAISADGKTPYAMVVKAIDIIRQNGIIDFSINADNPAVQTVPVTAP
jgi:biopolymer transport protein ExbD